MAETVPGYMALESPTNIDWARVFARLTISVVVFEEGRFASLQLSQVSGFTAVAVVLKSRIQPHVTHVLHLLCISGWHLVV